MRVVAEAIQQEGFCILQSSGKGATMVCIEERIHRHGIRPGYGGIRQHAVAQCCRPDRTNLRHSWV